MSPPLHITWWTRVCSRPAWSALNFHWRLVGNVLFASQGKFILKYHRGSSLSAMTSSHSGATMSFCFCNIKQIIERRAHHLSIPAYQHIMHCIFSKSVHCITIANAYNLVLLSNELNCIGSHFYWHTALCLYWQTLLMQKCKRIELGVSVVLCSHIISKPPDTST